MLRILSTALATTAILLFTTLGCSPDTVESVGTTGPAGSVGSTTDALDATADVSPVDEVSVEEAEAFAQQMLDAVATGDKSKFARLLNAPRLLDRAWAGIPVSSEIRAQFDKGFSQTFTQQSPILTEIAQIVSGGGDYALLRVRERDNHRTALFRALLAESGVNYHEFRLRKADDGTVYADDIFIMMSSEWFSETLNRICVAIAADADKTWFDKLVGKQQLVVKHMDQINLMSTSLKQKNPQEALRIFATLPAELKADKNVLLIRFRAASESNNNEAYMAAMSDIRRHHPDDPCCAMMLMDYDLLTKQYEQVMVKIDLVDEWVGGDSYSDILRAGVYMDQGKYDEAKLAGMRVIETQPVIEAGFWTLINVENKQKNFSEVVKWIEALAEHNIYSPDDFIATPDFADFVKSEEFASWQLRFQQAR